MTLAQTHNRLRASLVALTIAGSALAIPAALASDASARPGPTLLLETDPLIGLTRAHVTRARAWTVALTGSSC